MNKKLSLMLAAFVAAGWSLTAEAGVVKVTQPTSGNSYVIAETGWSGAAQKKWLESNGADVESPAAATAEGANIDDDALWQYIENGNGFILAQGDLALALAEVGGDPNMRSISNAVTLAYTNGYLESIKGQLQLNAGTAASWNPTSGTKVDFYAYTKKVEKAQNDVVLKVGNKYLVVTGTNTVGLVDEKAYQAYLTIGEAKRTLWNLSTDGKYASQYVSGGSNFLQITGAGATLVATGSASVFESNADENLFGIWNSTNSTFSYVKIDASGKLVSANVASDDDITIEASTPAVAPNPANT